jgi:pimeloyl-ACP methyl ester carboxylesterase
MQRICLRALLLVLFGCGETPIAEDQRLSPWQAVSRFIEVEGDVIHVAQLGSGRDVVLLHGLGDSSVGWRYVAPEIAARGYRVSAWDALGAGRSDKPPAADLTLPAHARRLLRTLDCMGIDKAVLVGHSLGGGLALLAAQMAPARFDALVLLQPAAYPEAAAGDRWFWDTPLLADIVIGLLPTSYIARYGLEQNFADPTRIPPALVGLYREEARRPGAIDAFKNQERQLLFPDMETWLRGYAHVRCPVLILWAQNDCLLPPGDGARLASAIPGARLVAIPNCGHSPHLDAPAAVLGEVGPFLERVAPRGPSA